MLDTSLLQCNKGWDWSYNNEFITTLDFCFSVSSALGKRFHPIVRRHSDWVSAILVPYINVQTQLNSIQRCMGGPDNEFGWDQLWGGVLQGFDGRAPEAVQVFFCFYDRQRSLQLSTSQKTSDVVRAKILRPRIRPRLNSQGHGILRPRSLSIRP